MVDGGTHRKVKAPVKVQQQESSTAVHQKEAKMWLYINMIL